jgi:hypothetical protein
MHLKEQSVKKQAINRYYFSIAAIKSSKESSNYNKIVCIAGVDAPEKSNISANISKKSKLFLGLSTGARRSCLKEKPELKNLVALSLKGNYSTMCHWQVFKITCGVLKNRLFTNRKND